jgi:hypothetical protein
MMRTAHRLGAALLLSAAGLTAVHGQAAAEEVVPPDKVLGKLAIAPLTGNLETPITVTTAGGCPEGTNSITRVFGKGFPYYGENVVGNSDITSLAASGSADRMVVPWVITLEEARLKQPPGTKLEGEYVVKLNCQEPLPASYDEIYGVFVGRLEIDKSGRFTALTTASDLPAKPRPLAGAAARGLAAKQPLPDPEDSQEAKDAIAAAAAAAAAGKQGDTDGSAAPLAFALIGGIVVLSIGATVAARRSGSRPATAGAGK